MLSPFLSDVGILSLGAGVVTIVFVLPVRLAWRRRKRLEEP
jgi:hypothetical protein